LGAGVELPGLRMRYIKPDPPESQLEKISAEEHLRQENQELKRKLDQLQHGMQPGGAAKLWQPSRLTILAIALTVLVLLLVAFLAGYIPLQKQRLVILREAHDQEQSLPRVEVVKVTRSPAKSELELPGNIQAITEAPILARADGYLARRIADIGDRVRTGQPLAEIEAPELDEQVRQAKASLQQAKSSLDEALANYEQGKANLEFARVAAERWANLVARGVVSKHENDQYQAQYRAQVANVQSLEKAVAVQRSNVSAAEANQIRMEKVQGYLVVRAPFDGVITLRNVDTGALVNAGGTLLFRIAQTRMLRTYVNVPQVNASSIHLGQPALLTVSTLPGRQFAGTVARTANALDPTSRTLLVEVQVPNGDGSLMPGMYARVDLSSMRADPPLLVPSEALIARGEGSTVALVRPDHTVHMQLVQIGRDYGDHLEITSGLQPGDLIIPNPGDAAREGLNVNPVPVGDIR